MAAGESRDGIEINGVAHVILRVKRISECIAFYDLVMPFLGLKAVPPRSDFFVYYVGGRTAVAIREADAEHVDVAHVETGPGLDHLCFRARSREDVDCVYKFLKEIGADIVRAPEEGPWAPGTTRSRSATPRASGLSSTTSRVRACLPRAPRSTRRPTIRSRAGLEPESDRTLRCRCMLLLIAQCGSLQ